MAPPPRGCHGAYSRRKCSAVRTKQQRKSARGSPGQPEAAAMRPGAARGAPERAAPGCSAARVPSVASAAATQMALSFFPPPAGPLPRPSSAEPRRRRQHVRLPFQSETRDMRRGGQSARPAMCVSAVPTAYGVLDVLLKSRVSWIIGRQETPSPGSGGRVAQSPSGCPAAGSERRRAGRFCGVWRLRAGFGLAKRLTRQ